MRLIKSFRAAITGFLIAWREQRNLKIHTVAVVVVCVGGVYLNFTYTDWSPPTLTNLRYFIEVVSPSVCVATPIKGIELMATNLNSSKSNVYRTGTIPTNIATQQMDLIVSLYPNPNNGMFTVDMKGNKNTATIKVFNIVGETIKTFYYSARNNVNIDLSSEPKGMYYVQIYTTGKTTTKKIIIE